MLETILLVVLIILVVILLAVSVVVLLKQKGGDSQEILSKVNEIRGDTQNELSNFRQEINKTTSESIKNLGEMISGNQKDLNASVSEKITVLDKNLNDRQNSLQKSVTDSLNHQEQRFKTFSTFNEERLDNIRSTIEKRLGLLQEENTKKLDEMRNVVDQKLQKTLDERMTQSFKLVNDRLEQVYKGLGEMQTLATGVGDLKKVLSNVKTRGILGEIQLGAILSEILSPEQYEENCEIKKGSGKRVEFAIKLPSDDDKTLYLPIDSKFPGDSYQNLLSAYDEGDKAKVDAAAKLLIDTVKKEAKDINEKYIYPPLSTDFGVMFIPFEGLYAELVNRGMVERLQKDYKVNIAGPSTMAALLNSLQMGFKTLAIQKRSSEVWDVLGAVKTEFSKFEDVITKTQNSLNQASKQLDNLVGARTRAINRKLNKVSSLEISVKPEEVLGIDTFDSNDDIDEEI